MVEKHDTLHKVSPGSGYVSRQDHQWENVFQPFGVSAEGVAATAKDAVDWNNVVGLSVRVLSGRGYSWLSFGHPAQRDRVSAPTT